MRFWRMEHLAEVVGGRWLTGPVDADLAVSGISIDSRQIKPGECYVAIRGERHDGHDFVTSAHSAGAMLGIVERDISGSASKGGLGLPLIQVSDTVQALQCLARSYRDYIRKWDCRVIAVTGSNGKTTTRHMIYHLLSSRFRGVQSPRSFNNHIGVPLTLLSVRDRDEFVIVELGSNHPGEISHLASIVRPAVGVITSIGQAHIGYFGDLKSIASEKSSLLEYIEPGGLGVIPVRSAWPADCELPVRSDINYVSFEVDMDLASCLPVPGVHNASNASAAAVVSRHYGISVQAIRESISVITLPPGRLEVHECGGGVTILNDAYNANPDSVHAALDVLMSWRGQPSRRVAVLGDMLELGQWSADLHRGVGERLVSGKLKPELVILIGAIASHIAEPIMSCGGDIELHVLGQWSQAVPGRVAGLLRRGDVVLLKASRAMALERLIPVIRDQFAGGDIMN